MNDLGEWGYQIYDKPYEIVRMKVWEPSWQKKQAKIYM